jgi:small-conductance mechanosensitive channel
MLDTQNYTVVDPTYFLSFDICHRVEHYQGQLLKCKDARMGLVNEVLNSMRVIKYYAWERKFTHKISAARRAEVGKLRQYAVVNAMMYTIWEFVPAIVGATAFVLHTYFLGKCYLGVGCAATAVVYRPLC